MPKNVQYLEPTCWFKMQIVISDVATFLVAFFLTVVKQIYIEPLATVGYGKEHKVRVWEGCWDLHVQICKGGWVGRWGAGQASAMCICVVENSNQMSAVFHKMNNS